MHFLANILQVLEKIYLELPMFVVEEVILLEVSNIDLFFLCQTLEFADLIENNLLGD